MSFTIEENAIKIARTKINAARKSSLCAGRLPEKVRIDIGVLQIIVDAAAKNIVTEECLLCRQPITHEHKDQKMTLPWYIEGERHFIHEWCDDNY